MRLVSVGLNTYPRSHNHNSFLRSCKRTNDERRKLMFEENQKGMAMCIDGNLMIKIAKYQAKMLYDFIEEVDVWYARIFSLSC